jgi:hypothetical protein
VSRALAAALVLIATPAIADDTKPSKPAYFKERTKVSMPFLFGADVALVDPNASTGFVFGWRPEVIFAFLHDEHGFGVGPYIDTVGSFGTHQIWLGGGGTIVGYFGVFGVALSAGLDCDFLHAEPNASPVFGLFAGIRPSDIDATDLPLGLRVDVRPSVGVLPTTIIVSAQLDLIFGTSAAFLGALAKGLSH